MRTYPANSPEAAVRIVAFTLLADGHLSEAEYSALWRHQAAGLLGLTEPDVQRVVQHLAEDLLAFGAPHWSGTGLLDEGAFQALLREVTDPQLRNVVLDFCAAAAQADPHHGEPAQGALEIARRAWQASGACAPVLH